MGSDCFVKSLEGKYSRGFKKKLIIIIHENNKITNSLINYEFIWGSL
jgi:hypothetical protein